MSDPPPEFPGTPFGDALDDVPLFREIQRVLLSSTGPINWELARQVGMASAAWGEEDPAPGEEDARELQETVRAAELAVAELTGLPVPGQLSQVRAHRRGQWVEANVAGLREMLEPVAAKLSAALAEQLRAGGELPELPELPGLGPQGAALMGLVMQRMAPLLMGAQVGAVLGYLGQRVLAQYDLPVPRPGNTLSFVVPNIDRFERDWSLPRIELRGWVAIHEVTHRFEFASPWVREHFLRGVRDVVDHAELDLSGLQEQLQGLDMSNPEAFGEAMEGMSNLFGTATDPEQRIRVGRLQAFIAAAEGYGDHVTEAVARRMLRASSMIAEALRRHREGRHGEEALERLLGLTVEEEQYRRARRFCDTVAEESGEGVLARMWSSPDALPSLPELEEPALWLARTV